MLILSREEMLEVFRHTRGVAGGEEMPHGTAVVVLLRTVPAFLCAGLQIDALGMGHPHESRWHGTALPSSLVSLLVP